MKIQRDKLLHFVGGALFCAAVALLISPTLALVATFFLGWAKEKLYDARRPDRHTVDGWDAYATAAGAVPALLLLAWLT